MKKFISVLLVVLTLVTASPVAEAVCPAIPASIVAEAASIRLSKKSLTLVAGSSKKIKVKGTKKKVKWSSSNKKVATVKKGIITAKKPGKATITAKVGKKKLKCKVTVKPQPVSVNKVSATYYKATNSNDIIAILKNNNARAVDVHLSVTFYDAKGNIINDSGDSNYCFEAGRNCALHVYAPTDGYATYKTKLTVNESFYTNRTYVKNIRINHHNVNEAGSSILIESENTGRVNLDTIRATVVFYDAAGKVVDFDYTYLNCKKAGESSVDTVYIPYIDKSDDYNHISFSSYKIFIDHAYVY